MTTQKAIEAITDFREVAYGHAVLAEALDMAIEALKVRTDGDTISRQDALDILHKAIFSFFDIVDDESEEPISERDELLLEVNKVIHDGIKNLPSAQPEIIRCKDCKDYQTDWKISHYPNRHFCATMDSTMPEDGFCSYAERKDNG